MPSNHLILCLPFSSSIRIFSSESALHIRWQKYWSFRFSISPCNEYSESFRIDWFDLLAVQGTLKSLLEHHSSKTSILRHSDFFKGFPGGSGASLVVQMVKNLPAMKETWVRSMGWEDPPWRRAWQHTPVFLPGESPWTEEPGGLYSPWG